MDLKSQLWTPPPPTVQTLFHQAPPPLRSRASSFSACLQAPSPAQALGLVPEPRFRLHRSPSKRGLGLPPPRRPPPPPLPRKPAPGAPGGSAPGPQGPAWQPWRAGGPRRARRGPTATPRASPQPPPGPSAPANAQHGRIVFKESWGSYGILQTVTVSV